MTVPDWFQDLLHREFDGRLRVRWSVLRQAFHVEQRVGRADGFDLFLELTRGDRFPCPECGQELRVVPFQVAEATCSECRSRHRDGRWRVGFFPLNDALLQYLRLCDSTLTDQHARVRAMDADNARLDEVKDGDYRQNRQDILKDGLIHEQIPKVGYTKDWAAYTGLAS